MTTTNNSAAKKNDVSSVHQFRGYITGIELVAPKAEIGQKRTPKPFYTVKASLHNGRSSKGELKYIYAQSLYVSDDVLDVVEDVYKQFQQIKEGETLNVPCGIKVVNMSGMPFISKGKVGLNWSGTVTNLDLVTGEQKDEGAE